MANVKLWTKQHSPELLLASGIVNSAASVTFAILATKKLPKVITPVKKEIVKLHTKMEKMESEGSDIKVYKNKLRKLYVKTGAKVVGMYAPMALTFGLSTASMIASHNIMKGRNAALAAALVTLKSGYDAYRDRVKEKLGEEAEEELFKGFVENKETKSNKEASDNTASIIESKKDKDFGVFWGPGNASYEFASNDFNMTTLLQIESYLNQTLEAQGYLFLADVYKALGCTSGMLGERKLQASHVVGWIYDKDNPNGDNYISFGLHDSNGELTKSAKRFQQGYDEFIYLDINVDGDILTGDYGDRTFMKVAMKKDC